MKRSTYIFALVLATPLSAAAQTVVTAHGPVDRVLAHRTELSLTADQAKRLEAIDRKYDEQNRELVAKLETLRGRPVGVPLRIRDMDAADREKVLANRDQIRPLMQQLRTRDAQAITEMRSVLTAEQNTRANAYLYRGRGPGQGRAGGGRGMMGQRSGYGPRRAGGW